MHSFFSPPVLVVLLCCFAQGLIADGNCIGCHRDMQHGVIAGHRFADTPCTPCHAGDPDANALPLAHEGLIAFPGNLDSAEQSCAGCHVRHVAGVKGGLMHTGEHMVRITRELIDGERGSDGPHRLQSLGQSPADSLLRKQCAGCHLGQRKTRHALDATHDRGGGCLACHLNVQSKNRHPALTTDISDARGFGCHARSSRISLSYAGLAETEEEITPSHYRLARLADGRLVERLEPDAHHRAGMSCIDCHTGDGLMGMLPADGRQDQAVDIACADCHQNKAARISINDWPRQYLWMLRKIPFATTEGQEFLVTRQGTPLWHIEVDGDGLVIYLKNSKARRGIPQLQPKTHTLQPEHRRLTCDACHAQWAPQCYECHLTYSRAGQQWDHIEKKPTPGIWREKRGAIRNQPPVLGVTADNRITPFVPGMIMSIEHEDWQHGRFVRRFGSLSPHTTGKARSCGSCHRSSTALGLGEGRLEKKNGIWQFQSERSPLADGIVADASTRLDADDPGLGSYPGDRSFNPSELKRILDGYRVPAVDASRGER